MKREEAIEVVKKNWPDSRYTQLHDALETLIPELAESEDERIRKDIVALIKFALEDGSAVSPGSHTTKEEALAYLEKLKEEEGYEAIPVESTLEYKLGFKAGRDSERQEEQKPNFDTHWENGSMVCEQKEQKPAEWSYPYGVNETADRLVSLAECLEMDGDCLFNECSGTEWGKFLRDLAGKQVECRSEWSDEDEKTLDYIINVLDRLGFEEYLKSSRDQDVEEERLCHKEIQCLKKLKSLRPCWKPSEEQMGALKKALHINPASGKLHELKENEVCILQGLLKQLENL